MPDAVHKREDVSYEFAFLGSAGCGQVRKKLKEDMSQPITSSLPQCLHSRLRLRPCPRAGLNILVREVEYSTCSNVLI